MLFMQDTAKHYASMVAVVEDMPVKTNQLKLAVSKDRYGLPLAEMHYNIDSDSLALREMAMTQGKSIFKAAGARETWNGNIEPMHIMGGTIMGNDPNRSVTNSYGQCHDIPNLVITGSGLFPTSAAVNPSFTLSALTLRASEHLTKNWNEIT